MTLNATRRQQWEHLHPLHVANFTHQDSQYVQIFSSGPYDSTVYCSPGRFGSNEKLDRWGMNRNLDRPVEDRTGMKEKFDLKLEFAPQWPGFDAGSGPSVPPSLFTALEEQLGFKLEPRTGPVDVFVIDHVEKPSESF